MAWVSEGKSQLVKCKDTGLYLKLYISIDNGVNILLTCIVMNQSSKV